MDDPRRLIDDPGGTAFGRSLLASARADAPSPDGRARAARRLGIAAVLVAGAGAGTEGTAIAAGWKLAAVLLALGGAVGLAVWQSPADPLDDRVASVSAAPSPQFGGAQPDRVELAPVAPVAPVAPMDPPPVAAPPASVAPPSAPADSVPAPRAPAAKPRVTAPHAARVVVTAPAPIVEPEPPPAPVEPPPAPEVEPAPAVVVPPVAPAPPAVAPPVAPAVTVPSRLAAEVALVDRARGQLGAGNYTAALAALAEYHQRFPDGDLDAEVDVVTIETLIAARQFDRARALGIVFLARFPRSPPVQHVHSMIDRLP